MRISEFQKLIRDLYFEKDYERGVKGTFIWLVEEIGELAANLNQREINRDLISEELADIIAWTHSIANLLDIDIENSLYSKYPKKCLKCKSNPCICEK